MLYLEDYLEMIEYLPQEIRDQFAIIREMDLQVQNTMETLEERVKEFFERASEMNSPEREAEYEYIKSEYNKALEAAEEKQQLANNMHELVSRYYRQLEQECHKFKMELEADHAGITEILEKRSEELDVMSSTSSQKENRFSTLSTQPGVSTTSDKKRDTSTPELKKLVAAEKMLQEVRTLPSTTTSKPLASTQTTAVSPIPTPVNYSHMGVGGSAIAAAASQAIAATQQMQQGRRTASLKASYEAISSAVGGMSANNELAISRELAGAAQTAIAAIQDTSKKNKKKFSSVQGKDGVQETDPSSNESSVSNHTKVPCDPNEPRYCICNDISHGDMIACDKKSCPYKWFHYSCVGITDPPKGSWYCHECLSSKKRKVPQKKKVLFDQNPQASSSQTVARNDL